MNIKLTRRSCVLGSTVLDKNIYSGLMQALCPSFWHEICTTIHSILNVDYKKTHFNPFLRAARLSKQVSVTYNAEVYYGWACTMAKNVYLIYINIYSIQV